MPVAIDEAAATQQGLAILERWKDAVTNHNMPAFGALYAEDAVLFTPLSPDPVHGRDGIQQVEASVSAAFPKATLTLHKPVAQGEIVAVEWEYGGKNTGEIATPMRMIPPTNREMHIHGASFLHIRHGLVVQERRYYDVRGMFQQLGLQ